MDDFIFEEVSAGGKKICLSLGILTTAKVYESERLAVYDSEAFGRCFYLDGALQLCERYHKYYHEYLVHGAMAIKPNAKKVLVIGGGDGGCVYELRKYATIDKIDWCEISQEVVDVARSHLPFLKVEESLADPRVRLTIKDGTEFIKPLSIKEYDAIIVDCSDPSNDSIPLYKFPFLKEASEKTDLLIIQCGNVFTNEGSVRKMRAMFTALFNDQALQYAPIPSYPGGGVCFYYGWHTPIMGGFAHKKIEKYTLNQDILEASFTMKPKSFMVNNRSLGFDIFIQSWNKELTEAERRYLNYIQTFDSEPTQFDFNMGVCMLGLARFDGEYFSFLRAGSVIAQDKIQPYIQDILNENKITLPDGFKANFVTWGVGLTFSMVKSWEQIKEQYPEIAAIAPDNCYDECLLSLTYYEGKLERTSVGVYTLSSFLSLMPDSIKGHSKIEDTFWDGKNLELVDAVRQAGLNPTMANFKNPNEYSFLIFLD